MSRSGYSDDCENIGLWRGAVRRATFGKRGQTFLKELAAAMDAMPERRLIKNELVTPSGECCTIGVVCKSRGLKVHTIDIECPEHVAQAVGISMALAAEIEYLNDEYGDQWRTDENGKWFKVEETPEQRWIRMRTWVDEQIIKEGGSLERE